ncbi:aldehyde dehydrogenase family protein [Leptothoe sp. PORK10 BA2]|uniref:aldehyde dehydrogenase family protein n=1 Tax=Leptothoe sp. PORK10 BA2 TaxID=3110254 RepID=UPI002B205E3F|nr:aldehyde dehydrogenase family protein [Leptothoe sp. PORK10 BA2]MEA5464699.1 aldehyde dehydrogenase family protein [Leptothoe sp. PORK10 BA2]
MVAAIAVRNPRTGCLDYEITPPTPDQLTATCERLRQGQQDWQTKGISHRIEALQAWKQALLVRKDALIQAIVADTGRLSESILEVDSFLSGLDRWCGLAPNLVAPAPAKTAAIPFIQLRPQLVPYGLVGVISPWNFPLLLSTIDLVPALLAGCAVVVKPSEIAPRFIRVMLAAIATVPALQSVLTYLEGAGETGAALIDQVDVVCFTGSVATGKTVAMAAAKRMIPVFLELGGKDPAIVLASADVDQAATALLWGSVVNAGQSCLSIERIYVARGICDRFVETLVNKAKQLNLAYPDPSSGQIGPIIAATQAALIKTHLQDALDQGAVIHCGGTVEDLGGGLWCRPTVLTQVNHKMKIMTTETFGPIMPVMPFDTVDDAIRLANDTIYGLSAAVFAGSVDEAQVVGQQIQAGAISLNDAGLTALVYEGEKNAFKLSGLGGSRMGPASIQRFMRKQVFLAKTSPIPDPWWF